MGNSNVTPVLRRCVIGGVLLLISASALFFFLRGKESPEALIASAKQYMARHDAQSATVQLKAALAAKPQSAEARFLLGSALFEAGDGASAEVELRKAIEFGYSDESAVPLLARTLLASGQASKLVIEFGNFGLKEPGAIADLQSSLALAYAEQNATDLAEAALARALDAAPSSARARVVKASFIAEHRDVDGALALLDEVLRGEPDSYEAWQLKGDLLFMARHEPEPAIEAQRQALKIRQDLIGARASIISIYLASSDQTAAQKELDELRRVAPKHPRTLYFEAELALRRGDLKTAKELAEKLRRGAPNNAQVLRLGGRVELLTGGLRSAEDLLKKALKAAPAVDDTRRLLVQTYLRLGQPDQALTVLKPLLGAPQPDARNYALAAQVYLYSGDAKAAESYFAQAAKLDPKDMRSRTGLALGELAKGHADLAYAQLNEIADADPDTQADMALISIHLNHGDFDAARKDLDRYERKVPKSAMVENLRGLIALAKKDIQAGRRHFELAVERDPLYFPATVGLAEMDMAQGMAGQAQKRFEDVLRRDPGNVQASLAIAGLRAQAGAGKQEVLALMTKAVAQAPTDVKARVALIDAQLAGGEAQAALLTAQGGIAAVPDNAELTSALARAQLATGDGFQAIATLKRLAEMQPQATAVHLQLAGAYVDSRDWTSARKSFQRAVALSPDNLSARRGLMMVEISSGHPKAAMTMARALQAERGHEALGLLYVGDVESAQRNWAAATAAYRDSLKLADTAETAIKLHGSLLAVSQTAEAERFSSEWRKRHPDDSALTAVLGDQALARRDFAAAETYYSAVIGLQPNSAGVLNNLAVAMIRQHKSDALAYAQKAYALEPRHPAIMDTLATALADANQLEQAIALQKRAMDVAPELPRLRLNLATLYIRAGQKAQAKAELQKLARLGEKYAEQGEVSKLLATL